MRFTALDLRNYGPFQGAPMLDLGAGDRGLHLIVGPNEAGKSTALRAIRALLFDFPNSTPDSHGRDLGTLRVGATLRDEAGAEITFLRRKRGNRLWSADDRTALPADALAPWLGRLDEATFETLFSTDHAELVAGGQAILQGKGRLGEMLFSAGTGLAQLDRVQKALQADIETLFKTRTATNPAINKTLIEWKTACAEVKKIALPTAEWVTAHGDWNRATAARTAVLKQKREAQAEVDRWRSWLGALRIIPRRQEVLDRLTTHTATVVLRPTFAEAYRADLEAGRGADGAIRDARTAIQQAEAELAQVGPLDPALLEADAIGRLHADLGRYASARHDRPELARQLDRAADRIEAIRAGLPAEAAIPAAGLAALREPIGKLAQDQAALAARQEEAEAELARLATLGLDPLSGPGAAVAPDILRWVVHLEEVLGRATAPGALEAQRLQAAGKLATAEDQAATALRGLVLWSGTLADLEALAIPPDATFDRAETEIRATDDRVRTAEVELDRLATERLELVRRAEQERVGGPIPTEADLGASRSRRDALWQAIRRVWVDQEPVDPIPLPARLADDYEAGSQAADALVDRLRREAQRVTAEALREIDRRDLEARHDLALATRDRAVAERTAATERWAALWFPLGIAPLSPREMKDWVKIDRKDRLRSGKAVRDARAEVARLGAQIDELRGELGGALSRVGEPGAAPGESLAALLARGRAVVARIGARLQRDAAQGRLDEVQAQTVAWSGRWELAVAPLGLPPDAPVAVAEGVVTQLAAYDDATRQAQTLRDQLADLAAIEHRFTAAARALIARLDPDRPNDEAEDDATDWQPMTAALVDRLARAGEARTRRQGCLARLDEEQGRLVRGQAAWTRARESLAALVQEAGCPTVEDLPAAIRTSAAVEADRAELQRFDEQLDNFAGAMTRVELLAAVAGLDDAALAARIAETADTVADLEAQANRLGEEIGAARQRLDAMNHAVGAADAEQVVQGHLSRLGGEVERYARLKVAAAVLRDAVERYRAKHQGPVLDRAGALFARLTAGSFVGLQTDQDEKGEPILRGVRGLPSGAGDGDDEQAAKGPLLDVTAMSTGTADQLYLALRLASLAVHLDDHEPTPLVADDILINCDDVRARAALEALADLSRRTQVLFFTHHDHLAEIARSCVPAADLFVHRLTPQGPIGEGTRESSPSPAPSRSRRPRATPVDS